MAPGTNKLAATGASSIATIRYTHGGAIALPLAFGLIPFAAVGSFLGATSVPLVDAGFIRTLVIVVMIVMTLWVVVRRQFGRENRFYRIRAGPLLAAAFFCFAIGFYDGFLGPGTGSLL